MIYQGNKDIYKVTKDNVEDYANKFLLFFCKDAIFKPKKINIEKLLENKGIKINYCKLKNNTFGKLNINEPLMIDSKIISIDPRIKEERGEGALRTTLIHETVHLFFHYDRLNEKCTRKEIEWMEWETRLLSASILMPKYASIQKYNELKKEIFKKYRYKPKYKKIEIILNSFASFFGTSIMSSKIRLKNLGFKEVEGVYNFVDGKYINSFSFNEKRLKNNYTYVLSSKNYFKLISSNKKLRDLIFQGKIVYLNNLLVVNNKKFIKKNTLTKYAYNHIDECALSFKVTCYKNDEINDELYDCNYLFNAKIERDEIIDIDLTDVEVLVKKAVRNAYDFEKKQKELPCTLNETLVYHINNAKKKKKIFSLNDLAGEAGISEKTIRQYIKGVTNPSRINIMKMGWAMRLSSPYIIDLLKKGDCEMTLNNSDNNLLLTLIYSCSHLSIDEIYKMLKSMNKEYILELPDSFLKNHNLK